MNLTIEAWSKPCTADSLDRIAQLWNNNAAGRHAFFPWKGELLQRLLTAHGNPLGSMFAAWDGDALVGYVHVNPVVEDGYPVVATVEAILVDAAYRKKGIGGCLLQGAISAAERFRPRPQFMDALGAWPFGYVYNTLADGSERSGVFLDNAPLYRLFRRAGFDPVRKSFVMRADLHGTVARPNPPGTGFYIGRRSEFTWLDRVFRGRELWDFDLAREDGRILSRAIFGFMENESAREGKIIFSLFGVNTPREFQNKGYGTINLSNLMTHVRDIGGEALEIHVYADNVPALALYDRLGFKPVAETMMMHRRP
ncbi:MAG: GNAT family N-acetyltransferase [Planctomycetaceae bacterium]|nr:GNAT family N-acetyltransferase [Planctomycetaceae bacterium]